LGLCITMLFAAGWKFGGIAQAILGLGFVIFVHELGHFLVAKMCGVKCEKFYLGFDIGGLKLAKFQWGETEYGIGILPLGGYVKMLGQDDNPSRAAEERRRSTMGETPPEPGPAQTLPGLAHSPTPVDAVLDPRSYMAKSVPQRMAIISAGVIMNVIFAFLMAGLAYRLGVPEIPCAVSAVLPGGAAWRADLQPGDRIVQIGDETGSDDLPLRFRDLQAAVTLSDPVNGVQFKIKRQGVPEPFWITIKPDAAKKSVSLAPTIGAVNPRIPKLVEKMPVLPNTPAAATKAFKGNDLIIAVDGQPIRDYAQLEEQLARHADSTLKFTVQRLEPDSKKTTDVNVEVPPRPRRALGMSMRLGKITAIQDNSPATKAGLQVDDFIVSIDGKAPGEFNTMGLPAYFRSKAGENVALSVTRKNPNGQDSTVELRVVPRDPPWFDEQTGLVWPGAPLSIPALGVALKVLNIVQAVDPDGPAADAVVMQAEAPAQVDRLASGDEITGAELIPADAAKAKEEADNGPLKIEFAEDKSNWPFLSARVQDALPDTKVKLTLPGDRYVEILPQSSTTEFNPDRGFVFQAEVINFQAKTFGQAMSMAGAETKGALTKVYSFLRLLGTQISPYALGGPVTIVTAAGGAADEGFSKLLLFLTMLSANLAVINFLPIPVLDGGHMVFLALEGIFRRPVSERVVVAFQYAGLLFIVGLMLFVLSLDVGLIQRH
jgi:regulator of sigma E protease